MRFVNLCKACIMALSACTTVNSVHAAEATATFNLILNVTAPTCEISVPPQHTLSPIHRMFTEKHKPLTITLTKCGSSQLKTALKAKVVNGVLDSDRKHVKMLLKGTQNTNGTVLALEDNKGSLILLDETTVFCSEDSAQDTRTCTLTPVTVAHYTDTVGEITATLGFAIAYP